MASSESYENGPAENPIVLDKEDSAYYTDGAKYWTRVEPTVDGMLGGLGFLSDKDVKDSERFLKTLWKLPEPVGNSWALDCGSGIGRITKNLLSRFFEKVDLVDQCSSFIDQARLNFHENPKIGEFFCCGLQKFNPPADKYDVIWMQWVLSHLTDEDLVQFLQRCKKSLRPNGLIVVKENCTRGDNVEYDSEDSSATRPVANFKLIFEKANFKLIKHLKQKNFPNELFPVWMFAIKPISTC